jgi:hypothetical protein
MKRLTILLLFVAFSAAFAQEKLATVSVNGEILSASVDRVGELYLISSNAGIQKFDINGKLLSVYKSSPAPTLFEPRDGSRLFAFFRKERRIEYLSPVFEVHTNFKIDSAFVIDPWLVCSSGEHDLWILDAADETLKKVSPRTSAMAVDVKFAKEGAIDFSSIMFMREYQGFLFLLEGRKGIHVFNGMGRLIKTIAALNLPYFNFLGEELYYPSNNKLVFINLFSGEQREIPISKPFKMTLVTDERLFIIQKNSVDFLEFKP